MFENICIETDGWTDRQTDRFFIFIQALLVHMQKDRDRQTETDTLQTVFVHMQKDRDRQTETDRQTDRQTDRPILNDYVSLCVIVFVD